MIYPRALITSWLAFALMAACSGSMNVVPSISPSKEPSPTTRATQAVVATSDPLHASTPTFAPGDAAVWAEFRSRQATLEARHVECPGGYRLELPTLVDEMSSAAWTIFTCSPEPQDSSTRWTPGAVDYGLRFTEIIRTDGSTNWKIMHSQFAWSNRPDAMLSTYRWSQDGQYLYAKPAVYPSGDGYLPRDLFTDGSALYQVDLKSGHLAAVLPYTGRLYGYSLSPNDGLLAYSVPDEHRVVHIMDVASGLEMSVHVGEEYDIVGAFAWTEDSTNIFFAAGLQGWEDYESGTSIFRLNVKTKHLQTFRVNDPRMFVPYPTWDGRAIRVWASPNLLFVRSLVEGSKEYYEEWAMNIETGAMYQLSTPEPPYATPTPNAQ